MKEVAEIFTEDRRMHAEKSANLIGHHDPSWAVMLAVGHFFHSYALALGPPALVGN
jgi:hypothetical protein